MTSWANFSREIWKLPSLLSLSRVVLGIWIPFLFLSDTRGSHLIAIVVFTVAAITDYYDGWVARKFRLESNLGKILDPTADKILTLPPFVIFAQLGLYSPWWVVPIFVREILVTFCRIGWMLEGKAVGAEALGKIKFVMQIVTLTVCALWLLSNDYPALSSWTPALQGLASGSLVLSVILTVYSGITLLYSHRHYFGGPFFLRFVSALGVGHIPFASGTWGSLLGVGLVLLTFWNPVLQFGVLIALVLIGWWSVSRILPDAGDDPSFVVVDEACGILIAFLGIALTWKSVLIGFFLFRFFDIVKPPPLRSLESLPGYWGVLLDDVGAGVYTLLILRLFSGLL